MYIIVSVKQPMVLQLLLEWYIYICHINIHMTYDIYDLINTIIWYII